MNLSTPYVGRSVAALPLLAAVFVFQVQAAPGAHGPNGEHLDTNATAQVEGQQIPSFEAKSEVFEIVGRLSTGELSLLIDRYQTNEPVLDASVEVESGAVKGVAKFHPDLGDYAIDDEVFLKALAAPGAHPMVVTVVAGQESDLLDGVLQVGIQNATHDEHDQGHGHDHGSIPWGRWALIALVFLGFALLARWLGAPRKAKKVKEQKGDVA